MELINYCYFFFSLLNFRQYFFLRMSGLSKNNPKTKSQLGGKKNRSFYEDLKAETPTFSDILQSLTCHNDVRYLELLRTVLVFFFYYFLFTWWSHDGLRSIFLV